MKKKLIHLMLIAGIISSCSSGTIGKYKKEDLPVGFKYKVVKDESNHAFGKNQITVEVERPITTGQIATIAEQIFQSKPKERRFYIFYVLPGFKSGAGAWATSHFNPELEIEKDIMFEDVSQTSEAKKIDSVQTDKFEKLTN